MTKLRKSFGAVRAVDDVSLTVLDGHFVTLLGASGCGKTTTLRMIAGLERPDKGEVRIGATVLSSERSLKFVPPERRALGFVFQSYALWPHMTVFDNIAYPLRVRRVGKTLRERVRRYTRLVGLDGLESRYPSELSGGQQQRVALARALVFEPSTLLLDEPLSNLDAELRAQMRVEIKRLHLELGITVIYVTHDHQEAMSLSDVLVLMRSGRIIESGAAVALYERPTTLYAAQLLGRATIVRGSVVSTRGREVTVQAAGGTRLEGLAADGHAFAPGADACACLKPESIRLDAGGGDGVNSFPATLGVTSYFGVFSESVASAPFGQLRFQSTDPVLTGHGDTVQLTVPREEVLVLPDEAGADVHAGVQAKASG